MAVAIRTQARPAGRAQARVSERAPQLSALTGLRFVAALWVLLYHLAITGGPLIGGPVVQYGYVGVSLFYILSGFILAYSYLDGAGRLRTTLRAFYVARVARLYPVYLTALLVALPPFLWTAMAPGTRVLGAVLSVLGLQAWVYAWIPSIDGPAWSVSVEMAFYLAFPALAMLTARIPRRHLALTANMWWLVALCWPLLYIGVNPDHFAYPMHWQLVAPWQLTLRTEPLTRLPEFALGLCLGRLYMADRAHQMRAPRAASGLALIGAVGGTLAAAAAVLLIGRVGPYVLLHNGLLDPFFALAIYGLAFGRGPLARALSTRPTVVLGEISYAAYLLHVPIMQISAHLWPGALAGAGGAVACLGTILVASLVCYRVVERPGRRAIRARWG